MRDSLARNSLRLVFPFSILLTLSFFCTAAFTQGPPAGAPPQALSPEESAKVWALQAADVAKSLSLSPELTTKLSDAYKAARESYSAALEELRGQGQEARRDFGRMREVSQAEKAKLETALKSFLDADQTAKAVATLGSFNRRWDSMVSTLTGMGLDEAAMGKAMGIVTGFVAESDKLMQSVTGGDFQAVRDKSQALREKLDTDMAAVLSAEQMTKWKEATAMRGGRQPRLPGGGAAPGAPAPSER